MEDEKIKLIRSAESKIGKIINDLAYEIGDMKITIRIDEYHTLSNEKIYVTNVVIEK